MALIGGGHAFGKTHGPCPDGAGKKPVEDPINPWPGDDHLSNYDDDDDNDDDDDDDDDDDKYHDDDGPCLDGLKPVEC